MDLTSIDVREHCLNTLVSFGAPDELCQFYADVVQCEYDITRTLYRFQGDLNGRNSHVTNGVPSSSVTDGHLPPSVLFGLLQNLIRYFNKWRSAVDRLVQQQPNIPPLHLSADDIARSAASPLKVKAGCTMETDQVKLHGGDDLIVTDTSLPNWLRVRSSSGDEGYVPTLSCILQTPDESALTAVERLQILLLTSWVECLRKLKTLLARTLSKSIKHFSISWNTWVNNRKQLDDGDAQLDVAHVVHKLVDAVTAQKLRFTSTELARVERRLCRTESELTGLNSNNLASMIELLADLDKAVLCYQAFNKRCRQFRQALCKARRPIKLVEHLDQLRKASMCNHFKYYELKMTVEEHEEIEEALYSGGEFAGGTCSGGQRSNREQVEEDKMTAVKEEERKRFTVRSVLDPRDGSSQLSLREAVLKQIVNYRTGMYVNPDTGEGVPIEEAILSGQISVERISVHRSPPIIDVFSLLTIRRLLIDDSYHVTEVLDSETAQRIPVSEAVSRGIIDTTSSEDEPEYVNTLTGTRISLRDAIEDGWVFAEYDGEEPRYTTTTHQVLGVVDRRRQYSLGGGPVQLLTFVEAIRAGLLDPRSGDYVDPTSGRKVFVAEAIRQGLIKTRIVSESRPEHSSKLPTDHSTDGQKIRGPTLALKAPVLNLAAYDRNDSETGN